MGGLSRCLDASGEPLCIGEIGTLPFALKRWSWSLEENSKAG
jgi:hypothetical protein